jgi:prepilin-type N-terminal cleavage/methylation domain-containing protein
MTRSPQQKRAGFTLIELLIVITIIAVLASMSFGAYQKVREAAARINCTNNSRSIGTALQNYYSSKQAFPTGKNSNTGNTVFWTIKDEMDLGANTGQTPVASYLCPSRRSPATVTGTPCDYGWSSNSSSILGSSKLVKMTSITDGTTNTILLGHISVQPSQYGGGGNDGPFMTNASAYARTPAPLYRDSDPQAGGSAMGSPHPSAVPHLCADNSVKTIDYDGTSQTDLTNAWIYNRTSPLTTQIFNQ